MLQLDHRKMTPGPARAEIVYILQETSICLLILRYNIRHAANKSQATRNEQGHREIETVRSTGIEW